MEAQKKALLHGAISVFFAIQKVNGFYIDELWKNTTTKACVQIRCEAILLKLK